MEDHWNLNQLKEWHYKTMLSEELGEQVYHGQAMQEKKITHKPETHG